jgi:LysR family transcriptional regulator, regulator for metE and metH
MQHAHDSEDPSLLEVRHLRLIRAVASAGGVTRAAASLHLSQSAVSHQLLALERDLGARLFDRVGKRMVPTPLGAHLAAAARRLLGELAALERSLDAVHAARLPLRVTSSCYTSYHWLPAALTHFAASHPQVELDIVIEATRRCTAALAADEVDLAITTDPPRDATWACEPVIASEIVAVASPKHPICARADRGALRWGALHDCEILVPDLGDTDLARLDDAVRTSRQRETGGDRPPPLAIRKVPLLEVLFALARARAGVVLLDRWTVPPTAITDLVVVAFRPNAPRTFHAVWRRANPRALPIAELVAIVREAGGRALQGHPPGPSQRVGRSRRRPG